MKNKISLLLIYLSFISFSCSQTNSIYNDDPAQRRPIGVNIPEYKFIPATGKQDIQERIEPPFWWVGMKNSSLEILIHSLDIKNFDVQIEYPGIKIKNVDKVQNPNYLFVEIDIKPHTKPGKFPIILTKGSVVKTFEYELKERDKTTNKIQGITPADLIYLIMPDRFANGDYSNDSFDHMMQTGINRDKMYFRHGGDIQGIINHLDYLKELGITAIWLNPVMENDQPYESYHGYAITDHYKIDKRFGTNELYADFVKKCHKKGIKVIMDVVFNHCGLYHWFVEDLPSEDWLHQFDTFTRTSYRAPVHLDPYIADTDKNKMTDGWFDYLMPDLNQQNPHLAKYFIQNNIWWTEFSGHDGYRIDTYCYPDYGFMKNWVNAMLEEHPSIGLFGETWVNSPTIQAFFTKNTFDKSSKNNIPAVTDFQLNFALIEALTKQQGWTEGISKVYYTLVSDVLYKNPLNNIIFLDNHDMSRFFSQVGEDINKLKSGIAFLLTMRGTPMLYYGTEILMKNFSDPDGKVREDFPGGWKNDDVNKFKTTGRTNREKEIFNYLKTLANYRKSHPVLQTGKFTHYIPENGVYVYFRHDETETVMVIMNTNDKPVEHPLTRYSGFLKNHPVGKSIITGEKINLNEKIHLQSGESLIIEVK